MAGIVGAVLAVTLAAVAWVVLQVWTAEDPRVEDLNPDLPHPLSEPTWPGPRLDGLLPARGCSEHYLCASTHPSMTVAVLVSIR
ncbi:hypothetical protein AHIS1636_34010 [Arthrobacter mangrovi]|uniref:Uncharacterized protein n=1 Tax=Arthrobacter mangrovi TaxID=2966350 RepID=A0ABQ5MYD2_9MICC|nr:hypothetical protein AHIS1636_34010 [Arthrobacter mangrovi]